MKKAMIWTALGLSVLTLLVALAPSVIWWQFSISLRWAYAAEYESCREEFNIIKNYVQSEYYDGKTRRYFAVYRGIVYDSMTGESVQWPTDVMAAIEVADREGFPQGECSLDMIWVEKDRITFSTEGKAYRLVYMMEGRPDGEHVKRIGKGWFHVT